MRSPRKGSRGIACAHDLDGTLCDVSDVACEVLGYAAGELVGRNLADFVGPRFRDVLPDYLDSLRRRNSHEGVLRVRAKDGRDVFLCYQSVVRRDAGKPAVVHGRAVNVTDLRRAATRKRDEALSILRATLNGLAESAVVIGRDGRVLVSSERFGALCGPEGSRFDERCARHAPEILAEPAPFVKRVRELLASPSATGSGVLEFRDGRVFEWASRPLPGEDESAGRVFTLRDVTAVARADAALRESEARYRRLFEGNTAGAFRTTEDGRILDCNPAFVKLLGFDSREELKRHNSKELHFSPTARSSLVERLKAKGQLVSEEVCLRRKDGSAAWFIVNVNFVSGDEGRSRYFEGTLVDVTALKVSGQSLRESEERFRLLFDGNPLPMLLWDTETRKLLAANKAAREFYGYELDEFRSAHITDLLTPEARKAFDAHWATAEPAGSFNFVGEQRTKSGAVRNVRVTTHGLRLGNRVVRFEVVLDVTDQTAIVAELTRTETRYRSLFEGIPLPTWLIGPSRLQILAANDAATRHYGYTREELLGMTVPDLLAPAERDRLVADRWEVDGGLTGRWSHVKSDGTTIPVDVTAHAVEVGGGLAFVMVSSDQSDRIRREEQARRLQSMVQETAREWASTFDTIDSPILVTDLGSSVKRLNRAALQLAGAATYGDVVGRRMADLGTGEPWSEATRLVAASVSATEDLTAQVRGDDGRVWQIVTNADVEGGRVILVAHDVTPLARLQESMTRAQTMAAIGALVSGVAHEVRNPLFGITATLDAMDANMSDNPDLERFSTILRKQTNRLARLMQDLLDYGRPANLELVDGAISDVVDLAVESCAFEATRKRVQIVSDVEEGLPLLRMDPARLSQVVRNLVENAIQHSPPSGTVSVRTRRARGDETGEEQVECLVEDAGPGIRPEDLPHVFEPFFTRRKGGTGLGLSIVHRIAEQHGARLTARNRPEGGAAVSLLLPVAPAGRHPA